MEIFGIATLETIFINVDQTILDAIELMVQKKIRRLPVIQGPTRIVGIVTVRDLIKAIYTGKKLSRVLSQSVRTIMSPDPVVIDAHASVIEAANMMANHNVGSLLLITDDSGTCGGIITERDLVKRFAHSMASASLELFYRKNPPTINSKASIKDTMKVMVEEGVRRVILVTQEHQLDGIVTASDIIRFIYENLEAFKINEQLLEETPVKKISTSDVIAVDPSSNVNEVASLMLEKKIGGVPVVDQGKVVGIFTERDLLFLIAQYGLLPD